MATKAVFILLFILFLGKSYAGLNKKDDFDKWVSWHVKNFESKNVLGAGFEIGGGSQNRYDMKLRQAEMNKSRIVVSQDGSGHFTTINDAIQSIPVKNDRRVIVHIKPGIYREKIVIDKKRPFVVLKGEDNANPPKITWNDTNNSTRSTLLSATVAVNSDYFVAINIIFENTAKHERGAVGAQAVALRISGTKGSFYNCTFNGYQDTLYDHKGLHYFKNCSIYGDVDFVFGYGQSFYEGCLLYSVATTSGATITAQKRTVATLSSGFSFKNCQVRGTLSNNNTGGVVLLGRSWGNYSRVIFSYTYMDDIVLPRGWDDWGNPYNDRTIYYGEYKCSGPGSNTAGRVPWSRVLTYEEYKPFAGAYFVEGYSWIISPYY